MVEVVRGARGLLDKGSSEWEPKDTILQHSSMYILTTAEPAGEQHPKVPNSWGGSYQRDSNVHHTLYVSNLVNVPYHCV